MCTGQEQSERKGGKKPENTAASEAGWTAIHRGTALTDVLSTNVSEQALSRGTPLHLTGWGWFPETPSVRSPRTPEACLAEELLVHHSGWEEWAGSLWKFVGIFTSSRQTSRRQLIRHEGAELGPRDPLWD